ncbi:hypothetical protein BKA66DRAFT_564727 [Pyrenochaeta sp. MPI-SDFR-AT-0127]|nr:hypothetical protein BKA66DRAFT_564727 [Pyrenochaeta sp. MPI-SDFR-AT-0127]
MRSFVVVTSILALVAAVPTPQALSSNTKANAMAYVRLIGDSNQHYSTGDTQTPSLPRGSVIPVLLGQSLDFSFSAPRIQAIEIARVAQGQSLSGIAVAKDDEDVVCKASMNGSSKGPSFRLGDVRVLLDGGRTVKLTGLTCGVEKRA